MSSLVLRMPKFFVRNAVRNSRYLIRSTSRLRTQRKLYHTLKRPLLYTTAGIFSYYCLNKFHFQNIIADDDESDTHFHLLESLRDLAPIIDAKVMLKKFVHDIKAAGGNIDDLHLDVNFLKKIFHEAGVVDDNVAEHIFHVMDWNKSGTLESWELAAVFTLFQVGDDNTRFKFLFRCLDLDGSGTVDKNEFRNVLTALFEAKYRLAGLHDDKDPDEWFYGMTIEDYHAIAKLKANMLVRTIFAWADQNRDGELNMKEFLHWCKRGGYEVKVVKDLLTQTMQHSYH